MVKYLKYLYLGVSSSTFWQISMKMFYFAVKKLISFQNLRNESDQNVNQKYILQERKTPFFIPHFHGLRVVIVCVCVQRTV